MVTGVPEHNGSVARTVIVAELAGATTFGIMTVKVVLVVANDQVVIPVTLYSKVVAELVPGDGTIENVTLSPGQ